MLRIRKALVSSLAGVFLCLFVMPLTWADDCALPVGSNWEPVTVKFVMDGDTLELTDGRRVRLIGVNAPERNGGRPAAPEPFSKKATERLKALVLGKQLKVVKGKEPKDRYGRYLMYLYDDADQELTHQLLEEGLGFRLAFPPNLQHQGCLSQGETIARNKAVGVWSSRFWRVDAARPNRQGFQLITGTVEKVSEGRRVWWLDLQGKVTVKLSKGMLPDSKVENLLGKEIEVRGWLRDRSQQKMLKERGYKPWLLPLNSSKNLKINGEKSAITP